MDVHRLLLGRLPDIELHWQNVQKGNRFLAITGFLSAAFLVLGACLLHGLFLEIYSHQASASALLLDYEPNPLDAMLLLFTPACSVWPTTYLHRAAQAMMSKDRSMSIDLYELLDDLQNGVVQLRNPEVGYHETPQRHCCLTFDYLKARIGFD